MSDALCGPSNALQTFSKQTSADRTLQQDRLATRHAPSQGFRSTDPRAGLLDPEFEAFQAGLPPSELPQYQHFQQPGFAGPAQQQQQPSWANDFQRMQISPQPFAQHHQAQAGPASHQWAQDFRGHIAQNAPRAQHSTASPQDFQQRARFGLTGFQSNFAPQNFQQQNFQPEMQSKGKEPMTEQFDADAFERAFDQARDDLMGESKEGQVDNSALAEDLKTLDQAYAERSLDMTDPGLPRHEIINDILQEPMVDMSVDQDMLQHENQQEEQQQHQHNDDDALAATAQELLEKIEHNQTDKFKNSQFLGLMRKLRDREMKVEGDKMVETVSASHDELPKHTSSSSPSPDSAYHTGPGTPTPTGESSQASGRPQFFRPFQYDVENTEFDHWESPATAASTSTSTDQLNSTSTPRFDNSEQRPTPLVQQQQPIVDTQQQHNYFHITPSQSDEDRSRNAEAHDGQDVVDLLNEPGSTNHEDEEPSAHEEEIDSEFMMTSPFYEG